MADKPAEFVLELFIADDAPRMASMVKNVDRALDAAVAGHYQLTVVNVLDEPERALTARVFATPMLIRNRPEPSLRVLGDLRDAEKVLELLGIKSGGR